VRSLPMFLKISRRFTEVMNFIVSSIQFMKVYVRTYVCVYV
jgi:hypothetical protein